MAFKLVNATELRTGTNFMIDGDTYTVKSMDVSKTGKHGHAKVRMEAISIFTGKKKVLVIPGHDRFELPMIDKRKAQVLSVDEKNANVMDSESYETLDLDIPEKFIDDIREEVNLEYWDIEGKKLIRRIL